MKRYITCLFVGICCLFWACSEDQDLTPSMKDQDHLESLLDKSNPDILSFKEKYGTYILYEFDQMRDFAYQFEEAANWRNAKLAYLQKEDIPGALAFLKQNFLTCYQDSVLLEYFPRKLLICSKIFGSTLGISEVEKSTEHDAVVSINSMTFARLDRLSLSEMTEERSDAYKRQLHYIYLAGYLVNVRRELFVEDVFFDPGAKLYGTKIDRTVGEPDEASYFSRGFFPLARPEGLFYPTQLDDLVQFIENLVKMNQTMCDKIQAVSVMRIKMQYVARGLKAFGVDVVRINPLSDKFL